MALPPETFSPSPKKLLLPIFFVVLFFAWAAFAGLVVLKEPARGPVVWPAYIITAGVPGGMMILSFFFLLSLLAKTMVDEDRIRIAGPLGTRTVRWADVVGHDITGTNDQGVTLYQRDGRKLSIPFLGYEGAGLRQRIDAELAKLPQSNVEGRVFWMSGRYGISAFLLGVMIFLAVAFNSVPSRPGENPMIALWLLAAMIVPIVAFALTDRIVLANGVLTKTSCYGTKRLVLAEVCRAVAKVVSNKNGRSEMLILEGPSTLRIGAQREGYAMLRDAVLSQLPPQVIEDKR